MSFLSLLFEPGLSSSEPVRTALFIGGGAALVSGVIGVFTVIRGQSFAGHSLSDISSSGGAAAFLLGVNPLLGFLFMGVMGACGMELLNVPRVTERDLVTGVITGAGLGLAALFLYWDVTLSSTTGAANTVMFGSMFAISPSIIPLATLVGLVALASVAILYRPLMLTSIDADLAAVRGAHVRIIGFLHLITLALAVSLSAITVGAILSTALLIGPAAIALQIARRPASAILLSAGVGVAATWGGIVVAYDSYDWMGGRGWPVSFCIVALIFLGYVLVAPGGTAARLILRSRRA